MLERSFIVFTCLFVLGGCVYDEPVPRIVHSPTTTSESRLIQPRDVKPGRVQNGAGKSVPVAWLPPSSVEKRWTAIVIHHSGTESGNAAIFDKWHREGNHWEGVGYDFVIGNGTDSRDGQVEVTFRWREQRPGAHCGGTQDNWANKDAVGICLVGDFNSSLPTQRQMRSLVNLVRFLQRRYRIPQNRIYGHNTTPGARITDCPGKKFPMAGFKSRLSD